MLPIETLSAQGRARRRQDMLRMKAKARRIYPHDQTAKLANHLASCSCLCCGNERHWTGKVSHSQARRAGEMVNRRASGRSEIPAIDC